MTTSDVGDGRDYPKEPAKIDYPNLKVTFPESDAQTWTDYFEDFVIKGNNGQDREKNGTLEFLSPDLKTVLGRIRFFNLGIFRLEPEHADAKNCDCDLCKTVVAGEVSTETIRKLQASLYCERMEFEIVSSLGD